jgi:hypothetical protein
MGTPAIRPGDRDSTLPCDEELDSIQIGSAPRALPAAHFDRNKIHAISGTGH